MLERVPSRAEGRAGGISPADALDRASEIAQSMANDLDSTRDMPLHRGGWIDIVLRGDEGFDFRVETAASLLMNAVKWSTVTLDLPAGIPSRGVHLVRRAAELFTTWETQAQRPDAFDLAVRADADASEQEATARHFRTLRQQEDLLQVFDAVADGIVVWQGCPYQSAHRAAITEGLDLCRSIAAAIAKGEDRSFVVGREVRTEDGPGVSWAMMVARLKRELVMARVKLVGQNAWPSQQVVYHVSIPANTSARVLQRTGQTTRHLPLPTPPAPVEERAPINKVHLAILAELAERGITMLIVDISSSERVQRSPKTCGTHVRALIDRGLVAKAKAKGRDGFFITERGRTALRDAGQREITG